MLIATDKVFLGELGIWPKVTDCFQRMLQPSKNQAVGRSLGSCGDTLRSSLLDLLFPDSCGPPPSVMTTQHYLRCIAIQLSRLAQATFQHFFLGRHPGVSLIEPRGHSGALNWIFKASCSWQKMGRIPTAINSTFTTISWVVYFCRWRISVILCSYCFHLLTKFWDWAQPEVCNLLSVIREKWGTMSGFLIFVSDSGLI